MIYRDSENVIVALSNSEAWEGEPLSVRAKLRAGFSVTEFQPMPN